MTFLSRPQGGIDNYCKSVLQFFVMNEQKSSLLGSTPISANVATLLNFGSYLRLSGFFQGFRSKYKYFSVVEKNECLQIDGDNNSPLDYPNIKKKGRAYFLHRMVWEYKHGAIPKGMCVLHQCDNRRCINPSHLFLGTIKDNNVDKAKKDRGNRAKLSPLQVLAIRQCDRKIKNAVLASIYNVQAKTISDVKNYRRRIYV